MTQEEKQLLLKDLCARLPYGVKAEVPNHINPLEIFGIEKLHKGTWAWRKGTCLVSFWNDVRAIENIKPYLRPMSSMTEEEKKEHNFYCGYKPYDENIGESYLTEYDMPDYIDFLYEHHLDFRGLIPKGLALEAPEGMYKEEQS